MFKGKSFMKKKPVLHLLKSNVFSGAENVVVQIIRLFKNERNMFYCSPTGKIAESLNMRGIKYIPLKSFNPLSIWKIINKYNINIIHAHDPGACVLAAMVPKKITIIAHVHGNHDNMKIISLKSVLFLICSLRYKKIIWVSNSSYNDYYFKNYLKRKSFILENVINPSEIEDKILKDRITENYDCIYLGRLSQEKDPIRAIKIIREVVREIPNFKMVFVGDGILKGDCQKLVKKYKLDNNIIFKGFQNNPIPYLYNSKLLLMTSKYEGIPMSALEAMCLGKPIISTPTDGLLELIDLNVTGFYSDNNNELIEYIIKLYNDKNKYDLMSRCALCRFEKYNNVENYKKRIGECYE